MIDYKQAKKDYLRMQARPVDVSTRSDCNCLIHSKQPKSNSPWVADYWFAREYKGTAYSARYESTSLLVDNVIKEDE